MVGANEIDISLTDSFSYLAAKLSHTSHGMFYGNFNLNLL